jgi:biotin carboxylase
VILLLVSPRQAGLPFERWLPELRGELVAVAAPGVERTDGFAEVVTVPDWTDTGSVLAAARDLAARYRPRAVLGPAEFDVERAAVLRGELGLPGLDTVAAEAYRDKVRMKEYARTAGLQVPAFSSVRCVADITAFMAAHPGRVVVKPRTGSGSAGIHFLDHPGEAVALASVVEAQPYEVEEFVEGAVHHVDAFRVSGERVAAVPSRYTARGCLSFLTDTPFGSVTLDPADPLAARLVDEVWRLIEALPSPPSVAVHAEFFVTADGRPVLCEAAARIGGGAIPAMLERVLGVDPRELWARVECGLPVDLEAVRRRVPVAPAAGFCGVLPRAGRVVRLPEPPPGVHDFRLHTHVGDDWRYDRYTRRKSAEFLASWVITASDSAAVESLLCLTGEAVAADFGWELEAGTGASS